MDDGSGQVLRSKGDGKRAVVDAGIVPVPCGKVHQCLFVIYAIMRLQPGINLEGLGRLMWVLRLLSV